MEVEKYHMWRSPSFRILNSILDQNNFIFSPRLGCFNLRLHPGLVILGVITRARLHERILAHLIRLVDYIVHRFLLGRQIIRLMRWIKNGACAQRLFPILIIGEQFLVDLEGFIMRLFVLDARVPDLLTCNFHKKPQKLLANLGVGCNFFHQPVVVFLKL